MRNVELSLLHLRRITGSTKVLGTRVLAVGLTLRVLSVAASVLMMAAAAVHASLIGARSKGFGQNVSGIGSHAAPLEKSRTGHRAHKMVDESFRTTVGAGAEIRRGIVIVVELVSSVGKVWGSD